AILRGCLLPRSLVERAARRADGAFDVRGRRIGHDGEALAFRRLDDFKQVRALRRDELAIDVKGVGLHGRQSDTIFTWRKRCTVAPMPRLRFGLVLIALAASPTDPVRVVLHAQDARASFTVGTATAARGARALGAIKVPAGVDSGYDIPVAVIHGAQP